MRGDALLEGPLLPLALRGALLIAATVILVGLTEDPGDRRSVLGFALALTIVIALAALPIPGTTARVVQAFAEVAVLGLAIGVIGPQALLFLPLLLLSVFTAGQRGGVPIGAVAGAVGGLSWVLAIVFSTPLRVLTMLPETALWTLVLVATGLIGGWVHRLSLQNSTYSDSAYEEAFRLLTELQQVTRNLSLGLDPPTLATGLVDEVGEVVPGSARTVSVRTGGGGLAPLAGHGTGTDADRTRESAWSTARHVRRTDADGHEHHAFPVRVGTRVVAVLDVRTEQLPEAARERVELLVAETGPRLAAALLFDEVRRLATVDERLRLAREIHDGIAQEVASVGYLLDDLAARVPAQDAAEVRTVRDHVRRVVGELRLSIFDLRAGVDDAIGLGTALSEYVQRVGQQSDLVVHTVLDEHGERLPAGTEVELLRMAQEAVTNVRRHAQASNMWVECTVDPPRAWLRVADDGVGLQPAKPQSMGLRGMRERARRIGGEMSINERPGGGTVVEISIGDWDDETVTP